MANMAVATNRPDEPMAPPPYPRKQRTAAGGVAQFVGLVRVIAAEYRTNWFAHVFFGLITPLGLMYFIKFASGSMIPREHAIFLMGGNLTASLTYGPTLFIVDRVGWGKQAREFDYWATLPISKMSLILAFMTVALIFGLPGLIGIFVLGSWLLELPLGGLLYILPIVPLCSLSMAGLGAVLGAAAKDGQTASMYGKILVGFVTFLSPTMIPLEAMPLPLQWISHVTPITYVAGALRSVLGGEVRLDVLVTNLFVLALFSLVSLVYVQRKLSWRQG